MSTQYMKSCVSSVYLLLLSSLFSHAFAQTQAYELWCFYHGNSGAAVDKVASIGDVNHDGFSDIIVGSPGTSGGGAAYILSGVNGKLLRTFLPTQAGEGLGRSVDGVGDINNDGYPDVIVGSPGTVVNSLAIVGSAQVYSGKDGSLLHRFTGLGQQNAFGWTAAGVGDVNKDGVPDVAVGAIGNHLPIPAGYVHVFSGADGKLLHQVQGHAPNGNFGIAIAAAGDLDGDGCAEFIVGENNYGNQTRGIGRVDVFSGKTGKSILTLYGPGKDSGFGLAVGSAGDIDGDKIPDVIGASKAYAGQMGYAAVYSGKTGKIIYSYTGKALQEYFGNEVDGGEDLNGDGVPDFLISAVQVHGNGPGFVNIYSGKTGGLLGTVYGRANGDWFGGSVAIAGRLDGDQSEDFVVGALRTKSNADVYAYSLVVPATATLGASPKVGTTIHVNLSSPGDANLVYVAGFSLTTAPGVKLPDKRIIPLSLDWLLQYSLIQPNPIFKKIMGVLDANGSAAIRFSIPRHQYLVGQAIYTAFVVLDPQAPIGIRRISKAVPIQFE